MKQIVADAIRFYHQKNNDAVYMERCRAPLAVFDTVTTSVADFGAEVDFESPRLWPGYRAQLSFGTYTKGLFAAEFTSTVFISKLSELFHVSHSFDVENRHEEAVEPTLSGYGNVGYIMKQFNFHDTLRRKLVHRGYTELDIADMDEIVPTLSFPEGVTIFGRQVNVHFALFHDLRGLCPAD